MLTYGNSASLLAANGYAAAPLSNTDTPIGPWAVMQVAYSKYPSNDELPVAVLTAVPAPRNEHDPVQAASKTWLATVTIKVRHELVNEVDAILQRYIGAAKCPVRIADDGSTLRVFRLAGPQFSTIATDTVRVESAASFIPLNGQWKDDIGPLDVFVDELPPLSRDHAQALIDEVDRLLDAHAPPVAPPAPFVPRPLLEPGRRLVYGNRRAMDVLRENGFRPPLPVRWGHDDVERDGFSDFLGCWQYNVDVSEHGVAINLNGFALVEFGTRTFRPDVDQAIRAMGPCLVRTVAGDDRPVYLFRCDQGGAGETIYSRNVHVHVRRVGLVVLSGADDKGREYKWSPDLLTVKAGNLAPFERHDSQRLQRLLEALPPTDYSKGSGKRRKAAA